MIRWMEDNRGLILTVVGLPLSFLFDLVMQVRNWSYRVFLSSPARHGERVAAIQRQVGGERVESEGSCSHLLGERELHLPGPETDVHRPP